ncbi:MAG: phosphotransferase family protein [Ruminococcus flavefaciens]|nr:phosphotransferase family protein [Ruminococcus flavefaciens]
MKNQDDSLKESIIGEIAGIMNAETREITDVAVLKSGMTNRSFVFKCRSRKYIVRVPGVGTDKLIDRVKEAAVYRIIAGKGICDNVVYMNPENGYKITEYLEGAKTCNPFNKDDIMACMAKLRTFHNMELQVGHEFDLFEQILFYEKLRGGRLSVYGDYESVKENVLSLKSYVNTHIDRKVLTHIDAVPDNFLITRDCFGNEDIRLIDWEYAGMQDPHVDIAMFCIYSMYSREQVDQLIDIYFLERCPDETRWKLYCYIAICGLLWSNWCEYKQGFGVEFGKYASRQYQYAQEYIEIVQDEAGKLIGRSYA